MAENTKNNGFLRYIMSGIILAMVFASFTWSTIIYRDLNTKLDNHIVHIGASIDAKMDRINDSLSKMRDRLNNISERISRIESLIK